MANERRTSAAREYMTPETRSLLETYGVARNHFEHARDPLISRQHVDLAREQADQRARDERPSILENGGQRLPEYINPDRDRRSVPEPEGSEMVRKDRPQPEMRPTAEFAKSVDRDTFDEKWFEEQARAERAKQARENEHADERDRNNDYEP